METKSLVTVYVVILAVKLTLGDVWVPIDGNVYLFKLETMDWFTARTYCETMNSHLVRPKTEDERKSLQNYLDSIGDTGNWMIGVHDPGQNFHFVWDDGSRIELPDWFKGFKGYGDVTNVQPSNGSSYCVEMRRRFTDFSYQQIVVERHFWNDVGCGSARPFICQRKAVCGFGTSEDTFCPPHHTTRQTLLCQSRDHEDTRSDVILSSSLADGRVDCISQCLDNPNCEATNFLAKTGKCTLLASRVNAKISTRSGSTYTRGGDC